MNKHLSLAAVALLVLASWTAPIAAQTFKIATIAPEGSSWMNDMRAGAKAIDERTEGRVKFKFYGGGVQGNDKQVQRKMRTGQLHGGAFTSGGLSRFQADADLFSLPMVFGSIEEARYVREVLEPELRGRLEQAGYVNFGFAAAGFALMMSNRPVVTLSDLNGRKVWTPEGDRASYEALKALGVAPVVMPVTDVMTGLQTDLLDSVTAPPVGAVVLQWHTRLKYISNVPLVYVYAAFLIDGKAFSRMSESDQVVVREVMEGIYLNFDKNGVHENSEALQALLDNGLELLTPQSSEVADWRRIVGESHRKLAAGGLFDPALLARMEELTGEYRSAGNASGQ